MTTIKIPRSARIVCDVCGFLVDELWFGTPDRWAYHALTDTTCLLPPRDVAHPPFYRRVKAS